MKADNMFRNDQNQRSQESPSEFIADFVFLKVLLFPVFIPIQTGIFFIWKAQKVLGDKKMVPLGSPRELSSQTDAPNFDCPKLPLALLEILGSTALSTPFIPFVPPFCMF